jgi:hypothetical protein
MMKAQLRVPGSVGVLAVPAKAEGFCKHPEAGLGIRKAMHVGRWETFV